MEKLRDWFGSPAAATNTTVWLLWASFAASIMLGTVLGLLYLIALGVEALV